jgi:hypothetical protein
VVCHACVATGSLACHGLTEILVTNQHLPYVYFCPAILSGISAQLVIGGLASYTRLLVIDESWIMLPDLLSLESRGRSCLLGVLEWSAGFKGLLGGTFCYNLRLIYQREIFHMFSHHWAARLLLIEERIRFLTEFIDGLTLIILTRGEEGAICR